MYNEMAIELLRKLTYTYEELLLFRESIVGDDELKDKMTERLSKMETVVCGAAVLYVRAREGDMIALESLADMAEKFSL